MKTIEEISRVFTDKIKNCTIPIKDWLYNESNFYDFRTAINKLINKTSIKYLNLDMNMFMIMFNIFIIVVIGRYIFNIFLLNYRSKHIIKQNMLYRKQVDSTMKQLKKLKNKVKIYEDNDKAKNIFENAKKMFQITLNTKENMQLSDEIEKYKFLIDNISHSISKLQKIMNDPCYYASDNLLYANDDIWTLTALKNESKKLGITLLSKYDYNSRKALSSHMRVVHQIKRVEQCLDVFCNFKKRCRTLKDKPNEPPVKKIKHITVK